MFHNGLNKEIYLCPTVPRGVCNWEGQASTIVEHFQTEHEDLLIKSNSIQVDVTQETEQNKLMIYENETFLVQITVCLQSTKLFIRLRLLGTEEESANIRYNVEILSNQFAFTNEDCSFGYSPVYNTKYGIEVDFKSISLMCNESVQYLTVIFNVKKLESTRRHSLLVKSLSILEEDPGDYVQDADQNGDIPQDVDDYLEFLPPQSHDDKFLSCSNCCVSMIPPIYMCSNDHGVCYNCKEGDCFICYEKITTRRNAELEEYSKTIDHVCRYQHQGCREKFRYDRIRKHEIYCDFYPYKCEICNYEGKLADLKSHFKIAHPSTKVHESMLKIQFPKSSNFVILNKSGAFYCSSIANELYIEWQISYCGPKERSFSCEIQIAKKKTQSFKSYFLKRAGNVFRFTVSLDELKRINLKDKYAVLCIITY